MAHIQQRTFNHDIQQKHKTPKQNKTWPKQHYESEYIVQFTVKQDLDS